MRRQPARPLAGLLLLAAVAVGCVTEVIDDGAAAAADAAVADADSADALPGDADEGDADSTDGAVLRDGAAPSDAALPLDAWRDEDAARPLPTARAPCAEGACWDSSAAPQLCQAVAVDEDFSTGLYNVHAYGTLLHAATPTRLHLVRTGGAWRPALIVATADGELLSDGSVGLWRDGVEVTVQQSGESGVDAALEIVLAEATAGVAYVTSWEVVESGFSAALPTDATYTLQIASACAGAPRLPCVVNGHGVDEPACSWLHHVGWEVVPRLAGDRDERLTAAARVAWWSLKEGVLFLQNPIVYSNCNTSSGDVRIGPLEVCERGRAWQVGLSGVQVWAATLAEAEATRAALYPALSSDQVLAATAGEAMVEPDTSAQIVASSGDLRRSWLLRDCAIGFTHQVEPVTRECIDASLSWCYGTGWTSTRLFAPDRDGAMQAIADIRALLDQLAP